MIPLPLLNEVGARRLPEDVTRICTAERAPPRLVAHLTLVHEAACRICERLTRALPQASIDVEEVCFGAAIHDIGKARCRDELTTDATAPWPAGHMHEPVGRDLLLAHGVSERHARFAVTHGLLRQVLASRHPISDILVAIADKWWKGRREDELEQALVDRLAEAGAGPCAEVRSIIDEIREELAAGAEHRIRWQDEFGLE